jgi:hypothetical protein
MDGRSRCWTQSEALRRSIIFVPGVPACLARCRKGGVSTLDGRFVRSMDCWFAEKLYTAVYGHMISLSLGESLFAGFELEEEEGV